MSNILIIKHGSLGDLIQANGAIKDIKEFYKDSRVILLTSNAYSLFMSECPYIDGVITDKRLPRWNLIYLHHLKKLLSRYNFTKVFDLQNSSRTKFYQKYILSKPIWSSSETTLQPGQKKSNFDKDPVLVRMEAQLTKENVPIKFLKSIDLNWALVDLSRLIKQYCNHDYILIFPFCSKKHKNKKWPFYKELVLKLKNDFNNKFSILVAPGPDEIQESYIFNAKVVLDNDVSLDIKKLITLINNAKFIISNDTGPAHIASHLNKKGLVLFGSHTSADKVSIENSNFKAISVSSLKDLKVETVTNEVKKILN
jgi:ADP-heptose:LPS heptosyltransferase|tara:strand:- start:3100 stop:4032 length:933 start_codon:yes stop_codon:yes gene_type:complete